MALYLVSYDIAELDAFEYRPLWERLESLGAVKILYSQWMIKTTSSSQSVTIYGELAPLTQRKDRLLVQEVTRDANWGTLLIGDDAFKRLLDSARP